MEEIKDGGGVDVGNQQTPAQISQDTGTWPVDQKAKSPSSSPPLQSSDRSAASSANSVLTSASWNNIDTGSGSSVEVSDESSSSPDVPSSSPDAPLPMMAECIPERSCGNITLWMNGGDTSKEGIRDRDAFNRVVGDAPQRAHIRLKSRHHRGKGDKVSDISSDSSSYNRDSPPNVLNLSNISRGKPQDGTLESEGSSGSGTFFRPTQNAAKHLLKHKTKGDISQSDAGIAACTCGSSTSQQSSMSVSRDSSGQDAGDSGFATRKSTSKRSLATHYQNIKRSGQKNAETSNSSTIQIRTMPNTETDSDRDHKRKRFNRTFAALRQCGLLDLTLQTATLMEQSQRMQKQLESLRKETKVLHDAMMQFSEVQPNFLQTNSAQRVMTNLEEIAKGQEKSPFTKLLADTEDTTTQLLKGALELQRQHMHAAGSERRANNPLPSPPKKLKQKHSASSSQTLTSTSSPNTDSDELQKQYNKLQSQLM